MKVDKLRGKIAEKYKTQTKFADKIGMTRTCLSCIMNGKHSPNLSNVKKMIDALELTTEEADDIFFTE